MENKVLVLLGMHRSGTSLLAKWLNACGLFLGHRQLGNNYSNSTGHYEDLDFLELHEEIFGANQIPFGGFENIEQLALSDYHYKKIEHLLHLKNDLKEQWGWKEPRTCLFTEVYRELLPEASYLLIYRHYQEVVDSLMRRKLEENKQYFQKKSVAKRLLLSQRASKQILQQYPDIYLKSWCMYNQHLVSFLESAGSRADANSLVFNTRTLVDKADEIFAVLTEHWGFNLRYEPLTKVLAKEKLQQNDIAYAYSPALVEEAEALYKRLEQLANLNSRSV